MFDPTIFDNIKVVLEGEIYDLDLDGSIRVVQRNDWIDLATMSREYHIHFALKEKENVIAEMFLSAGAKDLAMEILEIEDDRDKPGCNLIIRFQLTIENPEKQCKDIEEKINRIWDKRPTITQIIQCNYPDLTGKFTNKISLQFGRKIDEDNITDISDLVLYTVKTLEALL